SVEEAIAAAKEMMPLDYMEQPCRTTEELAQVRQQLMRNGLFVRVAADESIRKASDPYRVAELQAADVAIVKPAPLGGVRTTLEIAQNLRARHMDITVASAWIRPSEFPWDWQRSLRCRRSMMMKISMSYLPLPGWPRARCLSKMLPHRARLSMAPFPPRPLPPTRIA